MTDCEAIRLLDSPLGPACGPRGWRPKPLPDVLAVAFHRDARGVWETVDHFHGRAPQESLWEVVEYERVGGGWTPRWGEEAHYRMRGALQRTDRTEGGA